MTHARQQSTTKECTRAKEGRQADICKTSPGRVDKARCVVVCCDTMRFASCEALAMVNKSIVIQMEGFWRVCRQAGGRVGLNGTGVGMLGGGGANRISRRRVARRMPWRCVDRRPWALSLRRRRLVGRWLFASRNHLPSCCTPLVRQKLLCVAVRDVISTQFPRRRAAAPIRRPCRPPQRTLSPREVGEATVLAPDHGLQSTRDCAEAARAPPSTRHPNQRQSGRSVAGAAPLPAPFIVISILARDHGIGRVRRGCRPSATRPGGERQAFRRVSGYRISTTLVVGGRLGAPSPFPCRFCSLFVL